MIAELPPRTSLTTANIVTLSPANSQNNIDLEKTLNDSLLIIILSAIFLSFYFGFSLYQ